MYIVEIKGYKVIPSANRKTRQQYQKIQLRHYRFHRLVIQCCLLDIQDGAFCDHLVKQKYRNICVLAIQMVQ